MTPFVKSLVNCKYNSGQSLKTKLPETKYVIYITGFFKGRYDVMVLILLVPTIDPKRDCTVMGEPPLPLLGSLEEPRIDIFISFAAFR